MKLTKPGQIGASQLNSCVRRIVGLATEAAGQRRRRSVLEGAGAASSGVETNAAARPGVAPRSSRVSGVAWAGECCAAVRAPSTPVRRPSTTVQRPSTTVHSCLGLRPALGASLSSEAQRRMQQVSLAGYDRRFMARPGERAYSSRTRPGRSPTVDSTTDNGVELANGAYGWLTVEQGDEADEAR